MRVVICPDSFKEACSAQAAADALARGWRRARPFDEIIVAPLADGGEGTMPLLAEAWGCQLRTCEVSGPLGDPVLAEYAISDETGIAVIEMASASGLALVPPERRNPLLASTRGTGMLIGAALDAGATRIVVGAGGSATNDGGAGAAAALGVQLLDTNGGPIAEGGAALANLQRIIVNGLHPRLKDCQVIVATDVTNPLCGSHGASRVYGPQKGATSDMVDALEAALSHYADVVEQSLGINLRDIPGVGAAGGLAFGLLSYTGARIVRGIDLVAEAAGLFAHLDHAELVLTGEGKYDGQSTQGKVVGRVLEWARERGCPVAVFAGKVDAIEPAHPGDLPRLVQISEPGMDLADALAQTETNLEQAAMRVANTI